MTESIVRQIGAHRVRPDSGPLGRHFRCEECGELRFDPEHFEHLPCTTEGVR